MNENSEPITPELEQIGQKKAYLKLQDKAYEYLARREHSQTELRRKLRRFDEFDHADQLIRDLIQKGAQSDQRFAEQLGRVRVGAGKGPVILEQELNKNRIDPVIIETVMDQYQGQWTVLAEQVRQKKFGESRPLEYREWARQARFLQQRGFTSREISGFN